MAPVKLAFIIILLYAYHMNQTRRRLPAALRVILDAAGLAVCMVVIAGFFYVLDQLLGG